MTEALSAALAVLILMVSFAIAAVLSLVLLGAVLWLVVLVVRYCLTPGSRDEIE